MKKRRIIVIIMTIILLLGLSCNISSINAESTNDYNLSNPVIKDGVTTWDCIYFGNYLQDDTNKDGTIDETDEKQPIKWRVLSVDGNDAFLLADKCLDVQKYDETNTDTTWETCDLRNWLNEDFYNLSFSSEEQNSIQTTLVNNNDSLTEEISGIQTCNNTNDKIYLLSLNEVVRLNYGFSNIVNEQENSRRAIATKYTIQCRTRDISIWDFPEDEEGTWLLRTRVNRLSNITDANGNQKLDYCSLYVMSSGEISQWKLGRYLEIRPCLHLDLSSPVWTKAGKINSNNEIVEDTTETTEITETSSEEITTTQNTASNSTTATSETPVTTTESETTEPTTTQDSYISTPTAQVVATNQSLQSDTEEEQNQRSQKVKDRIKPTVTGVKNNKTYKKQVTIKFSDKQSGIKKATLNGKKIKSGKKVKKNGKYTLKVYDRAGNVKQVKFTIKIKKK